jgi:tripartite ATP-independent transporter DctP family solute receptor
MKGRKWLFVLLAAVLLSIPAFAQKNLVLNLGHGAAPSNPRHIVAVQFADYIKAQTNGRITINVHPSESLGSDLQMAQKVASGALDLSVNSQSPLAAYNPKIDVFALPFLFSTPKQAYAVLDGAVGEELSNQFIPSGFRVLSWWDNGFRQISNSKRPINVPDDLRGLKIRTPEAKLTISIFKTLGANPSPLAFGELYMALSQGLFDGQENPITNIVSSKLYEVQKYISIVNYQYQACPLIVSEYTWGRLSKEDQALFKSAALKFAQVHRDMNNNANDELIDVVLKAGVKVNQGNTEAFRAATLPVYKEFEPVFTADLIKKIQDVVAKN